MAGGALAAAPELAARLPLVGFGTGAVEVPLHAVTRGPVLAGVGLAGVRPAGNLKRRRQEQAGGSGREPSGTANPNLEAGGEAGGR